MAAAHMGVWEIDLMTNVVTWSETLAPVFGLTPAQAPTTLDSFLRLVHPDDRPSFTEHMRLAVAEQKEFTIEFRGLWPDGSHHWVGGRARVAYDEEGRPARLLGVGMDVHHEKLLERQFHQAQKMEAIGQLAGGIAHDFNNMLTAVLGNANLLLDDLEAESPLRPDLDEIVKAAERAAALTRQLLAFGRKQVMQPIAVDLNAIVKQSGGYIWVYSELGHGTTFKVYLPVADEAPQSLAPVEPSARALRGSETILVVEDEPAVRQLTRVLLERAGYRVIPAANA